MDYYHCSGYKGKCVEPYVREEVFEQRFSEMLDRLTFDAEVLDWVRAALTHSHDDERQAMTRPLSACRPTAPDY